MLSCLFAHHQFAVAINAVNPISPAWRKFSAEMSASEIAMEATANAGPNEIRKAFASGRTWRRRINEAQTALYRTNDEAADTAATHKNVPVTASNQVTAA